MRVNGGAVDNGTISYLSDTEQTLSVGCTYDILLRPNQVTLVSVVDGVTTALSVRYDTQYTLVYIVPQDLKTGQTTYRCEANTLTGLYFVYATVSYYGECVYMCE